MPKKQLSNEKSTDTNYFYEVVIYRIYKDRVETIGNKFYRTTSKYKGKDTFIEKDNNCIIMKQIIELWNC